MEEEILKKYKDAKVSKVLGSGGEFVVELNGEKIFSKGELDEPRFPYVDEISELIEAKM